MAEKPSLDGGPEGTGDAAAAAPPRDAAADVAREASGDGADGAASSEDASLDAASPSLLLLAQGDPGSMGTAFAADAWAPVTSLGDAGTVYVGGGLTALSGAGAIALYASGAATLGVSSWNGTWSPFVGGGPTQVYSLGAPTTAAGKVFVTHATTAIHLDVFDPGTFGWTSEVASPSAGLMPTYPSLAFTAAGEPLVVYSDSRTGTYQYVLRQGGTWSAAAAVPGLGALPSSSGAASQSTTRVGSDQIVAAFMVQGSGAPTVQPAMYSAGAWSVGAPFGAAMGSASFSLAPLPDGRVALAYLDPVGGVKAAFFDGTSWSAARAAVADSSAYTPASIALTQGVGGAVLELVYMNQAGFLRHTRLLAEAAWQWTAPAAIDPAHGSYQSVSMLAR